jgi:cytoskeletal protein CcmA (bactofilin family)
MKEPEGMSFPSASTATTGSAESSDEHDAYSLIDSHSSLDGTLTTRRDLLVEGNVTGTIRCEGTLYVAEGASVSAEVDAASIVVSGTMSGTIRCRGLLELRETGVVRGQVETARLTILEGAVYEGHISMDSPSGGSVTASPTAVPSEDPGTPANESPAGSSYQFLRSFSGGNPGDSDTSDDLPGADPAAPPTEPES